MGNIFRLLIWSKFTPRPFHLAPSVSYFLALVEEKLRPQQGTQSLQLKQVDLGDLDIRYKSLLC